MKFSEQHRFLVLNKEIKHTWRTLWESSSNFLLYCASLATVVAWFFWSSLMSSEIIWKRKKTQTDTLNYYINNSSLKVEKYEIKLTSSLLWCSFVIWSWTLSLLSSSLKPTIATGISLKKEKMLTYTWKWKVFFAFPKILIHSPTLLMLFDTVLPELKEI